MNVAPPAPQAFGQFDWSEASDHRRRQSRAFALAAAWLIGFGLVLLARELTGWTWSQAWPLFVVLLAAEGLIAQVFGLRRRPVTAWSVGWSLAWLIVGVALLATTTGSVATGTLELVASWWPLVVVALGAWLLVAAFLPRGAELVEHVAVPLPSTSEARVVLKHGAGTLTVRPGPPGMLVVGDCAGGVIVRATQPNGIELAPANGNGWPMWIDRSLDWTLGLATGYPISLRVDAGASRSDIDLGAMLVPYLELHAGANDTRISLPLVGMTRVRIEAGAASISLVVPPSVAASIRTSVALAGVHVDATRFRPTADGYATADVASNPNRVDIDLQGAISTLRVS